MLSSVKPLWLLYIIFSPSPLLINTVTFYMFLLHKMRILRLTLNFTSTNALLKVQDIFSSDFTVVYLGLLNLLIFLHSE